MVDYSKVGTMGLLSILAIFGGTMFLTQDQNNHAYVCEASGSFGIFYGGTSSTNLTAYPFKENRTQSKSCSSKWISMNDYLRLHPIPGPQNTTSWVCSPPPISSCSPV